MCYNFINLETVEFVLKQVHPTGKSLTSLTVPQIVLSWLSSEIHVLVVLCTETFD